MSFINRHIAAEINKQKEKFPVIAVTGPRQSGKTTLLKIFLKIINMFRWKIQTTDRLHKMILWLF